ncbi:S-layer homology domain-containing protein [Paenibacillus sp. LjRoot153]|uniref:S-layer homology domain-containing protein n=1 Tax=Paenibacillus sp. LjRoot153 TaxID=3342270 RepID=UPI003ECE5CFF
MKKSLILLSALFLFTACQSSTSAADSPIPTPSPVTAIKLKDVSDHWAMSAIEGAVKKGYVDGYEDSTFKPENNVSRAEFIKMVITAIKERVISVSTGADWSTPYIAAAINKGILRESDFSIDKLNEPITRLEMSRISLRATDVTLQNKAIQIDNDSIMYNSAKTGLIQGLSGGELAPEASTTRAQSVTIIERILTVNNGGTLQTDKFAIGQAELSLKNTNIFSMISAFSGKQNSDEHFGLTPYNPGKLIMETPDGKYKAQVDQIIAVDMDNPNDPNRSVVGDISQMKWLAPGVRSKFMVSDLKNYYMIVIKSHLEFNKDTSLYAKDTTPFIAFYGFRSPDSTALKSGTLNTLGEVYINNIGDVSMFVIPKSGYTTDGGIQINISAPAIPPQQNYGRTIVDITSPTKTN